MWAQSLYFLVSLFLQGSAPAVYFQYVKRENSPGHCFSTKRFIVRTSLLPPPLAIPRPSRSDLLTPRSEARKELLGHPVHPPAIYRTDPYSEFASVLSNLVLNMPQEMVLSLLLFFLVHSPVGKPFLFLSQLRGMLGRLDGCYI